MEEENIRLRYSDSLKSAILVYIVSKYKEVGEKTLGRTIMQKICYFLKFVEIPLPYSFQLYNYGPFAQELLSDMEFLQVDGLIHDQSEDSESSSYQVTPESEQYLKKYEAQLKPHQSKIDAIVNLVKLLDASDMELYSTTHYIFWAYKNYHQRNPEKEEVVDQVYHIKKEKFTQEKIIRAFDQIKDVGMFGNIDP